LLLILLSETLLQQSQIKNGPQILPNSTCLGVRFISYSYLNLTGVVVVTCILALFIWAQNYQLNQPLYQSNPFYSKFLLVLPITFLLNLPIVWGMNFLVMLLAKVEKKRYEAYLDQLEKEE